MVNLLDFIGRLLISALYLFSAYNKILNFSGTVIWMESFSVPGSLLWTTITLEITLPILVILGYKARIAASILSIFTVTAAIIFHSDFTDQMQMIAFLKNMGLAGGFIFIALHGTKDWSIQKKKKYVRL